MHPEVGVRQQSAARGGQATFSSPKILSDERRSPNPQSPARSEEMLAYLREIGRRGPQPFEEERPRGTVQCTEGRARYGGFCWRRRRMSSRHSSSGKDKVAWRFLHSHIMLWAVSAPEKETVARDGIDRRSCLTGCSCRMTASGSDLAQELPLDREPVLCACAAACGAPSWAIDGPSCGHPCGRDAMGGVLGVTNCLKGMVRLAGFEPETCCSGDKLQHVILLIRLAFSSVLIIGFTGCLGGIVPLLFPNRKGRVHRGVHERRARFP
jgi:hypothetical protein